MKEFWNERYRNEDYVYGEEPNQFLKQQLQNLPPGRIFFPCEGEGRNAVYAAKLGWEVTAADWSEKAKEKALRLAEKNKVRIEYHVCDIQDFINEPGKFHAIGLVFAHFPTAFRREIHRGLMGLLKPGGIVILEGFSKKHTEYQKSNPQVGGPQNPELLFSLDEIREDFQGLDFTILREEVIYLNEGLFHVGWGSVIRMVGKIV